MTLRFNRSKSSIIGLNRCPFKLSSLVSLVKCEVSQLPSCCLGLLLGDNLWSQVFWIRF